MSYKLLTTNQAKTVKGEALGYLTGILHLHPEYDHRLCPFASKYCRSDCLVNSGRSEFMPQVNQARMRKSALWFDDRAEFIRLLRWDLAALQRRAKRLALRPAVRFNGTADILIERYIDLEEWPEIQWYDYSKIPLRHRKRPFNYHLTFSFSGENWAECQTSLRQGDNVAVVFNVTNPKLRHSENNGLPSTYQGYPVINGVGHDLRFLDPAGPNIIGLIPKGKRAIASAKAGSPFYVEPINS